MWRRHIPQWTRLNDFQLFHLSCRQTAASKGCWRDRKNNCYSNCSAPHFPQSFINFWRFNVVTLDGSRAQYFYNRFFSVFIFIIIWVFNQNTDSRREYSSWKRNFSVSCEHASLVNISDLIFDACIDNRFAYTNKHQWIAWINLSLSICNIFVWLLHEKHASMRA